MIEFAGLLSFVGDEVLIPAKEIFCVVLQPMNCVVFANSQEDHANDAKKDIEALLADYDICHNVKSVEVMTAAKVKKMHDKEPNGTSVRVN